MILQRYFAIVVFATLIASGISALEQVSENLLRGPGQEEPMQIDHNIGAVLSSCPHLNTFHEDQHHHDLIRSHFEDLMKSAYIGLSRQDIDRAVTNYMDYIKTSCHTGNKSYRVNYTTYHARYSRCTYNQEI
jgi:hypothetical protein